jgi:cell division protein FtsL
VGFAVLASVLLGSMIFGIVVLNALLAQTSFRIDQAERRIETLTQQQLSLVREQATLSAPGRIAAWATRHGMRLPDDIRILHAPGVAAADPAGAGTLTDEPAGGPER